MAQSKEYTLTRYACYITNVSMAAVANLSPLLFVTFREMYGISYTLLGLLVVINFSTQLLIDLIFTFFSGHFNIHKTIRTMPAITVAGLVIYAIMPRLFPGSAYLWISLGTIVFSVAAGLNEVLISPVISAIPADNPEREMSKLHSTYAWGVVGVVIISALFLKLVGKSNWMYLALLWALIPLSGFIMFLNSKLPDMTSEKAGDKKTSFANLGIILCFGCIFLGGAAECTMTQWVSGFAEKAVGIPKLWGDIFGMALFAALLGAGRTLYSKYGKNIANVMLFGMAGAMVCYIVAGVCLNPVVCLIACVITGLCVSMLWPGTLIYTEENYPGVGVAVYALLASGGDFGASVAPQLVGIASDKVGESAFAAKLAEIIGITAEQIGMRSGILVSAVFPLLGILLILFMKKYFAKMKGINKC